MIKQLLMISMILPALVLAEDSGAEISDQDDNVKTVKEGTTIVGDQELPQVLYLIPWKSPVIKPTPRPEFVAERYVDLLNPCDLPESYWPDSGHRWPCKSLYADKNQLLR